MSFENSMHISIASVHGKRRQAMWSWFCMKFVQMTSNLIRERSKLLIIKQFACITVQDCFLIESSVTLWLIIFVSRQSLCLKQPSSYRCENLWKQLTQYTKVIQVYLIIFINLSSLTWRSLKTWLFRFISILVHFLAKPSVSSERLLNILRFFRLMISLDPWIIFFNPSWV